MHHYVLLRNHYQNQRGKNFRHSLYWIFTPGIALESWKILSGNFLFLELKIPGKFCPGRKLSWNFLKIISHKKYFSWNLQFWNFPFLEFSIPGILSWNFLFLESYFTEFSCYPEFYRAFQATFDLQFLSHNLALKEQYRYLKVNTYQVEPGGRPLLTLR